MPIIAMTTSSSTSENPALARGEGAVAVIVKRSLPRKVPALLICAKPRVAQDP